MTPQIAERYCVKQNRSHLYSSEGGTYIGLDVFVLARIVLLGRSNMFFKEENAPGDRKPT